MKYSENILLAPDTEVVCWCAGLRKGEIVRLRQAGATTLQDIRKATGACAGGDCKNNNPRGR